MKVVLDPEFVRTLIIAIMEIAEMVVPVRRHRIVKSDPDEFIAALKLNL